MDTPKLNAQVEETCMNAWPALKEVFYDGWLIRLANGATRRTNSVNVIGPGRRPLQEKIAYAEAMTTAVQVDPAQVEALRKDLGAEALVQLTLTVAAANFTNRFNEALGTELETAR